MAGGNFSCNTGYSSHSLVYLRTHVLLSPVSRYVLEGALYFTYSYPDQQHDEDPRHGLDAEGLRLVEAVQAVVEAGHAAVPLLLQLVHVAVLAVPQQQLRNSLLQPKCTVIRI